MRTDKVTEFLKLLEEQIRWKKAQPIVKEEIENHIEDLKNELIQDGLDEDKAIEQVIAEMGDPIEIGERLNRVHKPKPDWALLFLIGGILLLGLTIQYYLSNTTLSTFTLPTFRSQIIGAIIGIPIFIAAYFFDFTIIGKYPKAVFSILLAICIYYILKGNHIMGGIRDTIYPLLLFPTAFAGLVYSMRNKGYMGILACGVGFLLPAIIAILSPNMTMLVFLCISCLIILTDSINRGLFNVKKRSGLLMVYIPTAFISIAMLYNFLSNSWQRERLIESIVASFLPEGVTANTNWIGTQINLHLSHANFIGMGSPMDKAEVILPAAHTDFLLTHIIYNFGWIALIGIVLLFSALIIRGIILSRKQKSILGHLTSLSIITTLIIQCVLYISVNLGLTISGSLSLPLFSYGGKYLVINLFLLGLLLSVFRTGNYVRDTKIALEKDLPPRSI